MTYVVLFITHVLSIVCALLISQVYIAVWAVVYFVPN